MIAGRQFAKQLLKAADVTCLNEMIAVFEKSKADLLVYDRTFKIDMILLEDAQDAFDTALDKLALSAFPSDVVSGSVQDSKMKMMKLTTDFKMGLQWNGVGCAAMGLSR